MIATIAGVGVERLAQVLDRSNAVVEVEGCLLACLRVVEGRNHFLATYFDDSTQNECVGTV